jgi:hypothetical protein
MEAADSILPPLDSRPCEIMYLSILETAAPDPDLPLSKVYAFFDIFWKLSEIQALDNPYWIVI